LINEVTPYLSQDVKDILDIFKIRQELLVQDLKNGSLSQNTQKSFQNDALPTDVWCYILDNFIGEEDRKSVDLTCKSWHNAVHRYRSQAKVIYISTNQIINNQLHEIASFGYTRPLALCFTLNSDSKLQDSTLWQSITTLHLNESVGSGMISQMFPKLKNLTNLNIDSIYDPVLQDSIFTNIFEYDLPVRKLSMNTLLQTNSQYTFNEVFELRVCQS